MYSTSMQLFPYPCALMHISKRKKINNSAKNKVSILARLELFFFLNALHIIQYVENNAIALCVRILNHPFVNIISGMLTEKSRCF